MLQVIAIAPPIKGDWRFEFIFERQNIAEHRFISTRHPDIFIEVGFPKLLGKGFAIRITILFQSRDKTDETLQLILAYGHS